MYTSFVLCTRTTTCSHFQVPQISDSLLEGLVIDRDRLKISNTFVTPAADNRKTRSMKYDDWKSFDRRLLYKQALQKKIVQPSEGQFWMRQSCSTNLYLGSFIGFAQFNIHICLLLVQYIFVLNIKMKSKLDRKTRKI